MRRVRGTKLTLRNHTIQPANVSIPEMDDSMTVEMYENKTYSTNETWLQDVLSGGSGVAFKVENSSFGWVKDLPDNVTFVSVLGRKSMIPGDGGQCRFVFDPPLKSSGLFWRETGVLNYTSLTRGTRRSSTSPTRAPTPIRTSRSLTPRRLMAETSGPLASHLRCRTSTTWTSSSTQRSGIGWAYSTVPKRKMSRGMPS